MLPPKAVFEALSQQASRLFAGESPLPKAELESQFRALMQSAFSKLDLVSREEFDSPATRTWCSPPSAIPACSSACPGNG